MSEAAVMSWVGLAVEVGRLLAAERGRAEVSQAELARQARLTQQWVSKVENGAGGVPLRTVERLFGALGRRLRIEVEAEPDQPPS
jgi:transcriptional regulator with XRE-family HTH domain